MSADGVFSVAVVIFTLLSLSLIVYSSGMQ